MSGILLIGFLVGMRHALESDHIAAVATLTTRTDTVRRALPMGLLWGLGHTVTLFIFGTMVLALDWIAPEIFVRGTEFVVGLMLIYLGGDVLVRLVRQRVHLHIHRHGDGKVHVHAHIHAGTQAGEQKHNSASHNHEHPRHLPVRAFFVGIMHGMAGSAALVLLTLQAVPSVATGLLYIAVFGAGSMIGMAILSVIIALPMKYAARYMTWADRGLKGVVGTASIVLGLVVIFDSGVIAMMST